MLHLPRTSQHMSCCCLQKASSQLTIPAPCLGTLLLCVRRAHCMLGLKNRLLLQGPVAILGQQASV